MNVVGYFASLSRTSSSLLVEMKNLLEKALFYFILLVTFEERWGKKKRQTDYGNFSLQKVLYAYLQQQARLNWLASQ